MKIFTWFKYQLYSVMSSQTAMRTVALSTLAALLISIFVATMLTDKISKKTSELLYATTNIELKSTTAHLWLRDIGLGHHERNLEEDVLQHIESAQHDLHNLKLGFENNCVISDSLGTKKNNQLVNNTEKALIDLKDITQNYDGAQNIQQVLEAKLEQNQRYLKDNLIQLQHAIQHSVEKDFSTLGFIRFSVAFILSLAAIGMALFLKFIENRTQEHEQEMQNLARFPEENPNPILFIEDDDIITYANVAGKALISQLGLDVGSVIPKKWKLFCAQITSDHHEHEMSCEIGSSSYIFYFQSTDSKRIHIYIRDVSELRQTQKEHHMLVDIIERTTDIVSIANPDGQFIYMNASGRKLLGLEAGSDIQSHSMFEFHSEKEVRRITQDIIPQAIQDGVWTGEAIYIKDDGNECPASCVLLCNFDDSGNPNYFSIVSRSLLEQKEMQAKLEHTQRLESLGVLAGGIAHDFNNILTVIMGNASLAKTKFEREHPASRYFKHITDASKKAAQLCNQMLAYSGKGQFIIQPTNLSQTVTEMTELLEVSIDKDINMNYELQDNLPLIEADIAQLQQVILNLITNANDAMQGKQGNIHIQVYAMHADTSYLSQAFTVGEIVEGDYVALKVSDQGCGMSKETISRVFEPFFTTKFTGHGLGMSAVLGIIQGHKGALHIESKLDFGTTFTILLPLLKSSNHVLEQQVVEPISNQTKQTGILVVDDDDVIRETSCEILHELGFIDCFEAVDGLDALEKYQKHRQQINLVLLDMTMPRLDGEGTLKRLKKINPDIHVILCSGYSEHDILQQFQDDETIGFMQKPYSPETLQAKIDHILLQHA